MSSLNGQNIYQRYFKPNVGRCVVFKLKKKSLLINMFIFRQSNNRTATCSHKLKSLMKRFLFEMRCF